MVDNQRRSQTHRNRLLGDNVVTEPPSDSLTLWLSADAVTGLSDGESINAATIPDLSGNGRDFTGFAGTFEENEVNGYPVLQNNAGTTLMTRAGVAMRDVFGLDTCTVFGVYRILTVISQRLIYECSSNLTINWMWASRIYWIHQASAENGVYMSPYYPGDWATGYHLLECWRDGADGEVCADNGVELGAETDTLGDLPDTTGTLELHPICYGNFAELLAYDRALNAAERQQVRDYLGHKYALW